MRVNAGDQPLVLNSPKGMAFAERDAQASLDPASFRAEDLGKKVLLPKPLTTSLATTTVLKHR